MAEKRFCNSDSSFFLCSLWEKFGIRPLQRQIRNDDDVVKGLKSLEAETYRNGAQVVFNNPDFNLLCITDQVIAHVCVSLSLSLSHDYPH